MIWLILTNFINTQPTNLNNYSNSRKLYEQYFINVKFYDFFKIKLLSWSYFFKNNIIKNYTDIPSIQLHYQPI